MVRAVVMNAEKSTAACFLRDIGGNAGAGAGAGSATEGWIARGIEWDDVAIALRKQIQRKGWNDMINLEQKKKKKWYYGSKKIPAIA